LLTMLVTQMDKVELRSRFKIQPTADVLAWIFKTSSCKRKNADTQHLDASLSAIQL
jgi:hypothetical protein